MASTSATGQTYNNTNVLGEVLQIGATRNTGQFVAAISGNGVRRVDAQEFAMSATYSLDAANQNVISENTSLSAGTAQFYAKSQEYNVVQISKLDFASSDLRESATQQLDTTNIDAGGMAPTNSEFDRAASNAMMQFNADWEYSALQGTYVARSAVGTNVAMGGLTDSTVGISTNTVSASSASLSKALIDTLAVEMMDNGAQLIRPAFVCRPTYVPQLSEIYGFQPQSWDMGGVALKTIMTDFGEVGVIWTNAAPANTMILADLSYIRPVVLPQPNGQDVAMVEYVDGASAKKGYIQGFIGIDFGAESYHGTITSLA